jgi:hypothetical protein
MRQHSIWLLFLAVGPAFAQVKLNTVAISVTQQINLQPDQAAFTVIVGSGMDANLDQIVGPLSGLGITVSNLSGIANYTVGSLQWSFALAVPLASVPATIGSLTSLQQTIPQNNSGLTLSFTLNGTQVSAQLQQAPACSTTDLVAAATAQAQKVVAAAGLVLGPILKVSNLVQGQASPERVEAVFTSGPISDFLLGLASPPATNCSLTVQFQLLQ